MKDKNLKGYLQQSLGEEVQPKRLEETIKLCTEIVREQEVTRAEPRTGFFHYLSDVFRFEGIPIFGLQAVTLFIVCLTIASIADVPKNIPIFMPLFVLAIIPKIKILSAPTSSYISTFAPSMVPSVIAPFNINFMFPVPDASLLAVEICSLTSAAAKIHSAMDTR